MIKVHTIGNILVMGQGIGKKSVIGKAVLGSTAKDLEGRFQEGDILVARFTGADLIPYINQASAVIVEEGGLTSHAAIVGLHYGKPTIIGAHNATRSIQEGETVTVDAATGIVYKGESTVF